MRTERVSFRGRMLPTIELRAYIQQMPAAKFEEFKASVLNMEKVKDGKWFTLRTLPNGLDSSKGVFEETGRFSKTKTLKTFEVDSANWFEGKKYTELLDELFKALFKKYPPLEQTVFSDYPRNLYWRKSSFFKHLGFGR